MPTVVLKLFGGQGTGRKDRRTKRRLYAFRHWLRETFVFI